MSTILETLSAKLAASIAAHRLPGAAIAVLWKGQLYEAAAGVTNSATGVPVTSDTIFPFGSISKTITATMVLRLVDQGKLGLDAPARSYVPEFDPVEPLLADITIRQLLSHCSGLVGTIFQDTGRNEDALARQIVLINSEPMQHRPGALLSYCNSGMLLLGRCIETASGQPWDVALQTLVAEPLKLDALVARPEFALRHLFAVGHVRYPGNPEWKVDPHPFLLHGHSPAGSTPAGRARDLVAMAEAYLHGNLLRPETAAAAWSVQMPASYSGSLLGWGLGWSLFDWGGKRIVAHDGSTAGTRAHLRIVPEDELVVALLVNAPTGMVVYEDVVGALCRDLIGVFEASASDMPIAPVADLGNILGEFGDHILRLTVSVEADGPYLTIAPRANPLHKAMSRLPIIPSGPDAFYLTGAGPLFYPLAPELSTRLVRGFQFVNIPGSGGGDFLCNGASTFKRIE